jgi:hypothetical protein
MQDIFVDNAAVLFIVIQNGQTVQPIVDVERTVFDGLRFHVLG